MQELIPESNIAVGLDIGTSRVCVVVAEKNEFCKLNVLAKECSYADGIRRATVININKTVEAIKASVAEIECESSIVIHGVNVVLSGAYVHCIQSSAEISINQTGIVNQSDVNRFLEIVGANIENLAVNHEIIHVIPQEFIVDEGESLLDPIGMAGTTMRGTVYIVVGLTTKIRNIRQCVERAGLKIGGLIFKPVALGMAVIKEREKKGGVLVIDIGAGSTEIAIFLLGAIQYSEVINVASNDITLDIAHGVKVHEEVAEELKIKYGCADSRVSDQDEDISIDTGEDLSHKIFPKSSLTMIIEARMMEIFELVRDAVIVSGYYEEINAGVILTGGGALLPGVVELAQLVFGLDVRIGYPESVVGGIKGSVNSPMDCTIMGLVAHVYGCNYSGSQSFASEIEAPKEVSYEPVENVFAVQEPNFAWKKMVGGFQDWWAKL